MSSWMYPLCTKLTWMIFVLRKGLSFIIARNVFPKYWKRKPVTGERCRVAGHGAQPVDGVDDKVLLQSEVGQPNALRTVNDKHDVQGPAALLTVWRERESDKYCQSMQKMFFFFLMFIVKASSSSVSPYRNSHMSLWCRSSRRIPAIKRTITKNNSLIHYKYILCNIHHDIDMDGKSRQKCIFTKID